MNEGDGSEEDIDEYISEGVFFVPQNARWSTIATAAHTPEIGQIIDDAMRAIEKENRRLKDILPKSFARPELDKRRLGDVVDLFTSIQMIEHGNEKDIPGRAYEYCLAQFAPRRARTPGNSTRSCARWYTYPPTSVPTPPTFAGNGWLTTLPGSLPYTTGWRDIQFPLPTTQKSSISK